MSKFSHAQWNIGCVNITLWVLHSSVVLIFTFIMIILKLHFFLKLRRWQKCKNFIILPGILCFMRDNKKKTVIFAAILLWLLFLSFCSRKKASKSFTFSWNRIVLEMTMCEFSIKKKEKELSVSSCAKKWPNAQEIKTR